MIGTPDNALVQDGILSEGVNFLQKPFLASLPGKKVPELLDNSARAH